MSTAAEHPEQEGLPVLWRMFLGIGGFIVLIAAVYWFVSYEHAGTTLLVLAAGLAVMCGAWLLVQDRKRPGAAGHDGGDELYLPHASVWPFVIGLGAAICANALILGFAYGIPGALVTILGIAGFVAEGRRRG